MITLLLLLVLLTTVSANVGIWLVYRKFTPLTNTITSFEDHMTDVVTQIDEDIAAIGADFDTIETELQAVNAQLAAGSSVQQQLQSTLDKLNALRAKTDALATPPAPVVVTVSISPTALTLSVGQTGNLSATASDGSTPTFGSSDPSVATVDAAGVVTAVAPGTCTISAGVQNSVGASASITVIAAAPAAGTTGA